MVSVVGAAGSPAVFRDDPPRRPRLLLDGAGFATGAGSASVGAACAESVAGFTGPLVGRRCRARSLAGSASSTCLSG
jgi:hypothetical protein